MPDDRDHDVTAPTMAAAIDATVAAPATGARVPPASPSIDATLAAPTTDAGAITARTVGDDLRAATIDRFGEVDRDRFELLGELARGGLGRVFRARDPRTGRIVALKEVLAPSRDTVVRFAREAMVTANLQHPSIIPVYEVGRWKSGEPFYAMKLVKGRALDAIIAEATTTAARVALLPHVIDVADALAYAHSEHVIHRDLKPANVLVGPYGETAVIDWGIARNLVTDRDPEPVAPPPRRTLPPGQTVAGTVIGTPAYMAPEQAAGKPLDERADVYAIGALLYHVLSGVRPYAEQRNVDQILDAVEAGPPRPLTALAPDVPPELIAITVKAMARAAADRYPSAEGLAADLRRFQAGQLVGAHRYSSMARVRRWVARHRGTVLTAAVALVALLVFAGVSVRRIAAERDEAQRQRAVAHRERTDAQASRALAERRFGDSLEELGRQATLAGTPERALPFLIGAAASQPTPTPTLQLLLGQARDAFAGVVGIAPAHRLGTLSADLAGDRLLITTTADREVRAWDLATQHEAWSATGVHHVAVSSGGRWLLTVGDDGALSVRTPADGAVHKQWTIPPGLPREQWTLLAWSAAGDRFALGSNGGRVAVGTPDGDAVAVGPPHGGEVWSVAFAPGGAALITSAADGGLFVREPDTGALRRRLQAGAGGTVAAAWVDPERVASVDNDGLARVWRISTGAVERTLAHGPDPYGLAVDPRGAWLVSYGDRALAKLWDLRTGALRASLPGHHLGVFSAAAIGDWLITSDEAGGLLVWDPASGDALQRLPVEGASPALVVRGDRLVTYGDARPRVWRLRPDRPLRRLVGHTARVRDLAFDRTGDVVWSASNDDTARGVDLATGRAIVLGVAGHREPPLLSPLADPRAQPPSPHGLRSLALSADGATVYTAVEDGTIAVWDAATGAARGVWRGHTGRVRKLALSPDGATAYSVGDSTLRRWDVAAGKETARAELGELGWDVALIERGTVVVTLSDEHHEVALWDAGTLTAIARSAAGPNHLRELFTVGDAVLVSDQLHVTTIDRTGRAAPPAALASAFCADIHGATVAFGNALGEIALFEGAALTPLRRWHIDDVTVAALAFRPDGAILASASGRRVRLWDPATGRLLVESPEVPAMLSQLTWSPDGSHLAFAGGSGSVWVWDLTPARDSLDDFARCVSPWRLDDSALAATTFDPESCHALTR